MQETVVNKIWTVMGNRFFRDRLFIDLYAEVIYYDDETQDLYCFTVGDYILGRECGVKRLMRFNSFDLLNPYRKDVHLYGYDQFLKKNPYSGLEWYVDYVFSNTERYKREIKVGLYMLAYPSNPGMEKLVKSGFEGLVDDFLESGCQYIYENATNRDSEKGVFCDGNTTANVLGIPKAICGVFQKVIDNDFANYTLIRDICNENIFSIGLARTLCGMISGLSIANTRRVLRLLRSILLCSKDGQPIVTLSELIQALNKAKIKKKTHMIEMLNLLREYIQLTEKLDLPPLKDVKDLKKAVSEAKKAHATYIVEGFAKREKELSQYAFEDERLKVLIPKTPSDFLKEGSMQHNCVAGYIETYVEGEENIFFIRKQASLDKSYITISLDSYCFEVLEAFYALNREVDKDDDIRFIRNWLRNNAVATQNEISRLAHEAGIL